MLKKVLIVVAVLIVVLVGVISMQPNTYHIERSIAVAAPADVVHSYADDLKKQNQWSPWAKKDPNIKTTFSGPDHGVGASYAWDSEKVGAGKMTITESKPSHVIYAIEFFKPFADKGTGTVGMEAQADKVTVIWAMDGNMNFLSKAMCLVTSMDKVLGPDFEEGLQNLKVLAEAEGKQHLEDVARKAAADVGTGVVPPAGEAPVVPQPTAPPTP